MSLKRLKLGWKISYIEEYFTIMRSFRCAQYGHIAKKCENDVACYNCLMLVDKGDSQVNFNHAVTDVNCEWYRKQINFIRNKTAYEGKIYT